jgi:protein-tyrosine phosphatase
MTESVLFLCSGNYYRSRYAEIVFNSLAKAAGLTWTATSAGLTPENFHVNPGPISANAVAAARAGGHPVPEHPRPPRAATADDLRTATRIIALKESEHRPIILSRFAECADRVEYWIVHDVDVALPSETLPKLERAVADLVSEIKTLSQPAPRRDR